jgi:hypothetical protein
MFLSIELIIHQGLIDPLFLNFLMNQQIQIDLRIQQILKYRYFLMILMFQLILNFLMFLYYLNFLLFLSIQKNLMNHLVPMFPNYPLFQLIQKNLKCQLNLMYQIAQMILHCQKNLQYLTIQLLCSRIYHRIYKFVWLQTSKLKLPRVHY